MFRSTEVFEEIRRRNIPLPETIVRSGPYEPFCRHGDVISTSGQLPHIPETATVVTGRLREGDMLDEACRAGRICLARALLVIHEALGDLTRMDHLLSLRLYVNADADFTRHAEVANPMSELAIELLGDRGRHTRALVGVSGLPRGSVVELEVDAAICA